MLQSVGKGKTVGVILAYNHEGAGSDRGGHRCKEEERRVVGGHIIGKKG